VRELVPGPHAAQDIGQATFEAAFTRGRSGPAAIGAGHCVSDDSGLGLEGAAVPDSATSVASSLRQQVAACRGGGQLVI
jgi:hypothetical protein